MSENQTQIELNKIKQAIAAQEALRGTLPDADIDKVLGPLRQKEAELAAQLAAAGDGRILHVEGDFVAGDKVGGDKVAGDKMTFGGIRAERIEADNVVSGMQQIGGDLDDAADAVALAEALRGGSITADSIQAKNVVAGWQYIANPAQATPDELRQEIAALKQQLADALDAGEIEGNADMADAQNALETAEAELAADAPSGSRIVRKLKETADILTESAKATDAARKTGVALIKLAPVAAALYQIAVKLFGG